MEAVRARNVRGREALPQKKTNLVKSRGAHLDCPTSQYDFGKRDCLRSLILGR